MSSDYLFSSLFSFRKVIIAIFLVGKDYSVLRCYCKLVLYVLFSRLFFVFWFDILGSHMCLENVVLYSYIFYC